MRVAIDGYEANVLQRLGSSQVAFELIRNIEVLDKENDYTVFLPDSPLPDLPHARNRWGYKVLRPKRFWTRVALPIALFGYRLKPDVFFSPTHYIPRFCPSGVSRVATVFDLSYLHFPQMFRKKDLWQLTHWTKFSILKSDHIITISESSKKDIVEHYGVDKKKITVCYPGYNSEIFRQSGDREKIESTMGKYGISGDYVIFVGTIQPRKNLLRLIDAFSGIDTLSLVVVGKASGAGRQGWKYEDILRRPKELGIEKRVIFTGFVPDEDLLYLMNGATAFVLPSLWEGFGITAVDAMATGTPVIVSNVSSLPEIVGDAGVLVDPESTEQIRQAVQTVYADKKLRQDLSKKSLRMAVRYSWKKMAKEVMKVLSEVSVK